MGDKLQLPPRKARALTGRGALPNVENLLKKTPVELIRTLKRFGIDPDIAAIDRRAKRAFRTLDEMTAEGKYPSEAQWEKIAASHEKEMMGSLRQMTKQAIRLYKQDVRGSGPKSLEMWVTSELDTVCEDCEPLHGQIKTHAEWIKLGTPGTSKHVCGKNCNCELVPAEK